MATHYVDPAEFDYPSENAAEFLEVIGPPGIQLFGVIQFRPVVQGKRGCDLVSERLINLLQLGLDIGDGSFNI